MHNINQLVKVKEEARLITGTVKYFIITLFSQFISFLGLLVREPLRC